MTDSELVQALRNLQTDLDLSGGFAASDLLGQAAARILEMTVLASKPIADLEALWEKAWHESLENAVTTAIEHALHEQGVRTVRGE